MKPSQQLRKAMRKLTKKRWIQGFSALTKKGEMVATGDPKAVRFCAVGALSSVCDLMNSSTDSYLDASRFLDDAVRGKHKGDMVAFNDAKGRTWEQVIGVYRRAIDAAVKAGQ